MGNVCCSSGNEAVVVTKKDENAKVPDSTPEGLERMQSDRTIFYDALDRFPSDRDIRYPPTQSMRQLPVEFDIQETETFPLLLNTNIESPIAKSSKGMRQSVVLVSKHLAAATPGTQGRGYPGELTEDELTTCLEFREQLKKRNPAFKEMVTAMHPHENEAFSLCRFLRARDFVIDDVFTMMEEKNQLESWHEVKRKDPNFFRDFTSIPEFNGCPLPVLMTQFPFIHSGIGKNGAIVIYFKAGHVNCPGVECIVGDLVNSLPFMWNKLYHGCRNAMEREISRSDAATTMVLAEKIVVTDLAGDSSLFSSGINLLTSFPTASSCFPESINRAYLLNAPLTFSIIWAVISRLIDPRTVKKIGFFSSTAKAKTNFSEHIDSDELLSDYGGTGQSFDDIMASRQRELAHKEGVVRYVVETLTMNGSQIGFDFDISNDERVDSIVVYSRSNNMCEISVVDGKSNNVVAYRDVSREQATSKASELADAPDDSTSHNNYAVEIATSETFAADAAGPFFINTKGGTKGDYFLVAVSIADKKRTS